MPSSGQLEHPGTPSHQGTPLLQCQSPATSYTDAPDKEEAAAAAAALRRDIFVIYTAFLGI